jgi:hypothetical protein
MVSRAHIIAEARSYIDTPWRHQGRSRTTGVDCVGLLVCIADTLGLADYDDSYKMVNYSRRPDGTLIQLFRKHLISVSPAYVLDGDVVIFVRDRQPCHCGIKTTFRDQPGIIHAHMRFRKVVEQTLQSAEVTVGKPVYYFRFPKVED